MTDSYAHQVQTDTSCCLVCGQPETRDTPFVAVLRAPLKRNAHHFMHAGACHEQHRVRCRAERGE